MGPWIEIISASILTLKGLMDVSSNFLDTLVTHGDRRWCGTIFLSFLSSASVCLSPSQLLSALFRLPPAYGLGALGGPRPHLPPTISFCLTGRRGAQGYLAHLFRAACEMPVGGSGSRGVGESGRELAWQSCWRGGPAGSLLPSIHPPGTRCAPTVCWALVTQCLG